LPYRHRNKILPTPIVLGAGQHDTKEYASDEQLPVVMVLMPRRASHPASVLASEIPASCVLVDFVKRGVIVDHLKAPASVARERRPRRERSALAQCISS